MKKPPPKSRRNKSKKSSAQIVSIAPSKFKKPKPLPVGVAEMSAALDKLRGTDGRDGSGREVDEYGLIPQHAKFVKYYMLRHNATWAAKMAGYSLATCHTQGCELKKHPKIAPRLAQLEAENDARFAATDDNIIRLLLRMALVDARELHNDDGSLKPIHELSEEFGQALTSIEAAEMESQGEDGAPITITRVRKYKLSSRDRAAELLMKHRGMLSNQGPDKKDRLHEIVEAMRDAAAGQIPPPAKGEVKEN